MTPYQQNEKEFILESLRLMNGNRIHAARYMGIAIRTLQRRLKAYDLPDFALSEKQKNSNEKLINMMKQKRTKNNG